MDDTDGGKNHLEFTVYRVTIIYPAPLILCVFSFNQKKDGQTYREQRPLIS